MTEVAAVAEQPSASAEQVSASTQQTSASTQEIAASAQDLAQTAEAYCDALVRRLQGRRGQATRRQGFAAERRRRFRAQRVQQQAEVARPVLVHRRAVRGGARRSADHPQHQQHVLGHEVAAHRARLVRALQRPRRGGEDPQAALLARQRVGSEPVRDDVEEALVGGLHACGAAEVVLERGAGVLDRLRAPGARPRRGCPRRWRGRAPPWWESAGRACPCPRRRGARSPPRRRRGPPPRTRCARRRRRARGFERHRPAGGGRGPPSQRSYIRSGNGRGRCGSSGPRRSVRGHGGGGGDRGATLAR